MDILWKAMVFLVAACGLGCNPAAAEKRVALVIGNSVYHKVASLPNPANDAVTVAAMLSAAGFDSVESKFNLPANDLRKTLREFATKTRDADIAVVYYAGHGIELDGTNYLIPVDAALETDGDVLDETVPLDRVLFAVEPARQLRLIILDACRDNPFAKIMKRTTASRAIGRGLARVEPTSPNTMIAFAAKAGSTASDGNSKNSPFATALVEYLPKPGLDLRRAFGFVRDDVLKATGNKQEPYVYGSLGGDDLSLVPAKPATSGPQSDPQAAIRRDYELALQAGDREAWEAFLQTYADGFYANLAKVQLKKIAAETARLGAVEKVRLAEQEKAKLAAEGAKQAEQAKAAAAASAAEDARIKAEKVKQIEQENAAAAEKLRIAEQEKVRIAAEREKALAEAKFAEAERARAAAQAKVVEDAKFAAEKARTILEELKAAEIERAKKAEADAKIVEDKAKSADEKAKNNQSVEQLAVVTPKTPDPEIVKIFDGFWDTKVSCDPVGQQLGWSNRFLGTIKNGRLDGQTGIEGKPASITYNGFVDADGTIRITATGLTGDPKYTVDALPRGSPFFWRAAGMLQKSTGTALRTEGRKCVLQFSKQSLGKPGLSARKNK